MNIKNYLKKLLVIPKELFQKYPLSIIVSILSSLIIAIFLEESFLKETIIFLIFFGIGTLFTEIFFDKKRFRIASYTISCLIAIIFNEYILDNNEFCIRLAIVYGIGLFILGLLKMFKQSQLSIGEYTTRVVSTLFKVQVISSILSTGVFVISGIIVLLFGVSDLLMIRCELLFVGIFALPALIYSFSNTTAKVWDFIKFMIKNLLGIILLISFLIIYVYMLKIIITFKVPSNHIFRIISVLFIFGLPVWTMISSFNEKNFIIKINNKLPIVFIPLLLLQIYSISLRIMNNGLTIMRYIGICLVLVELAYIMIYLLKKEKVYLVGYIIIILCIVGLIIPKVNAIDLTINTQYKHIINYLNKEELTKKEKYSLYQTYHYLNSFDKGKKMIKTNLTKEQINFILQEKIIENECYYSEDYSIDRKINVSGFKTIQSFNIDEYDLKTDYSIFKKIEINNHYFDLLIYIKDFMSFKNPIDYLNKNNMIIQDNCKLIINDLHLCVEENLITSYSINGYILEK